jgi:oligopeptide/dipeptide ABC transporter ATP-binding protein
MTIGDAVAHPLLIQGLASHRAAARARAAAMLERVGITPAAAFLDRYPEDLSGGQKQRIVLARALVTGPSLVVADEPVAMLDMSVRALVLDLMAGLRRDLGLTYVLITHDLATARLLCDRVAVMYLGRVVEVGPAGEVLHHPRHPYTQALLDAVPRMDVVDGDSAGGRARLVAGEVPDATDIPGGCRFHPRCPFAFEACGPDGTEPALEAAGPVEVACHLVRLAPSGPGNPRGMENEAERGAENQSLFQKIVERARGTGVGTEDPNIVGDAGPTDAAPGRDPDSHWPPNDPGEVVDPEAPV